MSFSSMRKCLLGVLLAVIGVIMMPVTAQAFTNLRQTNATSNSATITWDASPGEEYYEISYGKKTQYWKGNTYYTDSTWVDVGKVYGNSYTFKGLIGGEYFNYYICSYDEDGTWISYQNVNDLYTLPGEVEVFKHKYQWGYAFNSIPLFYDLSISFVGQDTAEGYQLKLMNHKGKKIKTWKIEDTGNTFYYPKIENLNKDVYCIQIRAYTTYKKKKVYSKWCDKIYVLKSPLSKARYKDGKIEIAWDKVNGASGYDLYMCTKKKGKYKKVASVSSKKTSVLVKKYGGSKIKKNKTYYYYIIAKKKSGKKTFKSEITYRNRIKTG